MRFGGLHLVQYKVATPIGVPTETTWWCRGNSDLPSTNVICHVLKHFPHLYVHVTHRAGTLALRLQVGTTQSGMGR